MCRKVGNQKGLRFARGGMCVPIAERREVRFDGRKTLNLQVFNGPLPLPLGPSFPLCLPPSFFSPLTPRRHFTLNIQPNSRTEGRRARFSIDFLIYSALRKERSVSSFQGRGRERGALWRHHRRGCCAPHGWKTPTHCSNMPFARDRTNEQNEACLL